MDIQEMDNNKYLQAIKLIQDEQSKIIGEDVSRMILSNVAGLHLANGTAEIDGDPVMVLNNLVNQYATIFGKASVMISKQAIKQVNPSFAANELPDNLK